jgi:hypothetical protein
MMVKAFAEVFYYEGLLVGWLNSWFVRTRLFKLAGFSIYDSEN